MNPSAQHRLRTKRCVLLEDPVRCTRFAVRGPDGRAPNPSTLPKLGLGLISNRRGGALRPKHVGLLGPDDRIAVLTNLLQGPPRPAITAGLLVPEAVAF